MDESLILSEIGKLRTSVFGAMNDLRIEVCDKIDTSANERRSQVDKLMKEGCFQGQLDRVAMKQQAEQLKKIEELVFSDAVYHTQNDKGKKMKIGYGKFKFDAVGFKATDIILILFTLMMGFVLWNQSTILNQAKQNNVDTEKGQHVRTVNR